MQRFTRLFEAIDRTTSLNAKVAAIAAYFRAAEPANAVWALYLLLGKTRRRLLTSRVLRDIFLQASDIPPWLFEDCYAQVGDSAEVIALLLPDRPPRETPNLPLQQWMEDQLPQVKAVASDAELHALVLGWWASLDRTGVFVLNKMLTGAFRMGASEKLVIRGLAAASGVSEAVLAHRLMGNWEPTVATYAALVSPTADDRRAPSQPYPFFLASPLDAERFPQDEPDLSRWQAEWKWDGIRAQLIKREGLVFLWSRGEDLITPQFPELEADAQTHLPDGVVLDGEILCWRGDRPLSFNHLQKRLGRKRLTKKLLADYPVHFLAYDLLEQDDTDLRDHPLQTRRDRLETLLTTTPAERLHLSEIVPCPTFAAVQTWREKSRDRGAEGLMLKALDSPYLVGRKRGYWWKYKVDPMSLDAVLIYAQAGSGKRANLFTDYTFALWQGDTLVTFAKAYSGLDNAEIDELDRWIRRHTIERFGPVRSVEPVQVFEIGFEGIAASKRHKSGISVRFPRILRWRKDKPAAEADTLAAAQTLLAQQPHS